MQEGPHGSGMGASSSSGTPARLARVFPSQHKPLEPSPGFFLVFNPRPCLRLLLLPTSSQYPPRSLGAGFPPALLFAAPIPLPTPQTHLWPLRDAGGGGRCRLPRPLADGVSHLLPQVVSIPHRPDAVPCGAGGAGLHGDAGRHVLQRLDLPRGHRGLHTGLFCGVPPAWSGLGTPPRDGGRCSPHLLLLCLE